MNRTAAYIELLLKEKAEQLEKLFGGNLISYYGPIHDGLIFPFQQTLEALVQHNDKNDCVVLLLNTNGGSVEASEKLISLLRYHFKYLKILIPEIAMSAGTIMALGADEILMDYSSSLGPIDPQVYNGTSYVPALNYLDKVNDLLKKAENKTLTQAEFLILKEFDLAELKRYEQARDLAISLITKWLAQYKFKDWNEHRTDKVKKGRPVSIEDKEERAKFIATNLSDHNKWLSHSRYINMDILRNELRIEITDFGKVDGATQTIRDYHQLLKELGQLRSRKFVFHTKVSGTS